MPSFQHRLPAVGITSTILTIDSLSPIRSIPPSRLLNQPGPRLIKRDVIPVEPLPQLVSDPQADAKEVRRAPSVAL